MADPGKESDIDKLLAEVNNALEGKPDRSVVPAAGRAQERPTLRARATDRLTSAAVAGLIAAGVVWLLFALLPFLGAASGAAGAFLGVFAAVLLVRRRTS